jgi:DNA-binding transcriptional regulator YhcF (GntR family)
MSTPKYVQAANIVRAQIADGTLKAGLPAPSGTALAHITGYSVLTCRRALQTLVTAGVLTPGPSRNARLRVPPGAAPAGRSVADAADELSTALAARRRAVGLSQIELAALSGYSVTAVGHAETGRLWQSRRFWESADKALCAGGELLRLQDVYRIAATTPVGEWTRVDVSPQDRQLTSVNGQTGAGQEQHMTHRVEQGRFYVDHSAVVTARMPDPDECASGYPPDVPVLVITSHAGRKETVFASDRTELIFGDPDGVPNIAEVTRAADFVFGIIAEDLANVGAKLEALVHAAETSPGSVTRLADQYRQERIMEMFCSDTDQCVHAAHAATELAAETFASDERIAAGRQPTGRNYRRCPGAETLCVPQLTLFRVSPNAHLARELADVTWVGSGGTCRSGGR